MMLLHVRVGERQRRRRSNREESAAQRQMDHNMVATQASAGQGGYRGTLGTKRRGERGRERDTLEAPANHEQAHTRSSGCFRAAQIPSSFLPAQARVPAPLSPPLRVLFPCSGEETEYQVGGWERGRRHRDRLANECAISRASRDLKHVGPIFRPAHQHNFASLL
jgi:hypothetical protein